MHPEEKIEEKTDIPRRIDIRRKEGLLEVAWRDGAVHRIGLSDLRRACPCALCEDRRERQEKEGGLRVIGGDEMAVSVEVLDVVAVGRYAIQIRWGDGHDTGIYTYGYLRKLTQASGGGA